MNTFPWSDLAIIVGLILVNGLFAMSELAIVSARPARLKVSADKGSKGARVALQLADDPGKFLSTVQIGITLVGIIAGAYSGASLGHPVGDILVTFGVPYKYAHELGFVLVIAGTTYGSLVIGELVPKQIALRGAEKIAIIAALPMSFLAKVMAPVVWLLDRSSSLLLRLLGVRKSDEAGVTAEELQMIFAEATRSGVIEEDERQIMAGIMRLADRPVREVMTPRTEVQWIDRSASDAEIRNRLLDCQHGLLPVVDGAPDNVVGIIRVREMLAGVVQGKILSIDDYLRKAEIIPDQIDIMDALPLLQQADVSMALVHDEYGHLEGVVTPADLMSALVGDFVSYQDEGDAPLIVEREDGSLLIAGALTADAMSSRLNMTLSDDREFATAAGYVLSVLKRMPVEGDAFTDQGWRFEVVDMDGRKIDKLLVSQLEEEVFEPTE